LAVRVKKLKPRNKKMMVKSRLRQQLLPRLKDRLKKKQKCSREPKWKELRKRREKLKRKESKSKLRMMRDKELKKSAKSKKSRCEGKWKWRSNRCCSSSKWSRKWWWNSSSNSTSLERARIRKKMIGQPWNNKSKWTLKTLKDEVVHWSKKLKRCFNRMKRMHRKRLKTKVQKLKWIKFEETNEVQLLQRELMTKILKRLQQQLIHTSKLRNLQV
jgi:hypothetical protein